MTNEKRNVEKQYMWSYDEGTSMTKGWLKATEIAKRIAGEVYSGQQVDCINHCVRVSQAVRQPIEKVVAHLHDVFKDGGIGFRYVEESLQSILDEKPNVFDPSAENLNQIMNALRILTKNKPESYLGYILQVKENNLARVVKIADIYDNLHHGKLTDDKRDFYKMALYILDDDN